MARSPRFRGGNTRLQRVGGGRIEGFSELYAALKNLTLATEKGILARVGRQVMTPMAETAQRLAPDDSATSGPTDLRTNIGLQVKRARTAFAGADVNVSVVMGPDIASYTRLKGGRLVPGPKPIVQEFGSIDVKGTRYMTQAWNQHSGGIVDNLATLFWPEIEKSQRRAARRAARVAAGG